jgi:hypothetical protein
MSRSQWKRARRSRSCSAQSWDSSSERKAAPPRPDNHPCRQEIVAHLRHEVHHCRTAEGRDQQKV